jgi:hypothetical protein
VPRSLDPRPGLEHNDQAFASRTDVLIEPRHRQKKTMAQEKIFKATYFPSALVSSGCL